jgi:hypothetical protein
VFPYDLRNTAQIIERHVARLSSLLPVNYEFVGMANFSVESTHDLPTGDSERSLALLPTRGAIILRGSV